MLSQENFGVHIGRTMRECSWWNWQCV